MNKKILAKSSAILALMMGSAAVMAQCPNITHAQLTKALNDSVKAGVGPNTTLPPTNILGKNVWNGGLDFNMWATVVGDDGSVCLVTKTGTGLNDQWLISRVISAQKANTALGLSTTTFALSTANLYTAVQTGGTLFGLQHSNPVDTSAAYSGSSANFGKPLDPMYGRKIGGVNVFGGGLALYNASGKLVGGLGVSGDTSCADHNIAWRTREALALALGEFGSNDVPAGVGSPKDNIIYTTGHGFAHPQCSPESTAIAAGF
jgi:uncharacterized protein GlcG (DUF336 family)